MKETKFVHNTVGGRGFLESEITTYESFSSWYKHLNVMFQTRPLFKQRFLSAFVGVEIEVEKVPRKMYADKIPCWGLFTDGSLRNNGVEFVTVPNLRICSLYTALTILSEHFHKVQLSFSHRTSVHVHHNMLYKTFAEVESAYALYLLAERDLYVLAGLSRINSPFCRPNTWVRDITGKSRYFGLNRLALGKYASFEFRQLEGNLNAERIFHWVVITGLLVDYVNRIGPERIKTIITNLMEAVDPVPDMRKLYSSMFGPYFNPESVPNTSTIPHAYYHLEEHY